MNEKYGEYMKIYWDSQAGDEPDYVRGHVTESEARDALNRWEHGMGEGRLFLRHIYARWTFPMSAEYDRELHTYDSQQKGAFALTEIRRTPPAASAVEP